MEAISNISEAEFAVMNLVWAKPGLTSHAISDLLAADHSWSASTIKTMLARLVKKGVLVTHQLGKQYQYTASVDEDHISIEYTQTLFQRLCDRHQGKALQELLKTVPISQADIAAMQDILQARAKSAPEVVSCHCIPDSNC